MSDENVLLIGGIIGALVFIFMIIDCCTDNTTKITKGRRRSRHGSPRFVTVTQVTADGPTQTRIPLNSNAEVIERDGFILPPEPGDENEATPVVVPPYPVEARHPTPQVIPAPAGFATSNPPYPTQNPHAPGGAVPYPNVAPYPPVATPYPPAGPPVATSAPFPDYSGNPPSYSEAVGQPPVQPPLSVKEGYLKQSPYNPNY